MPEGNTAELGCMSLSQKACFDRLKMLVSISNTDCDLGDIKGSRRRPCDGFAWPLCSKVGGIESDLGIK